MDVQEIQLARGYDRIKFEIQSKYGGFIVSEALYEGPKMVSSKELGIVYSNHHEAVRAIDSLIRLSKASNPGKTIEWTD